MKKKVIKKYINKILYIKLKINYKVTIYKKNDNTNIINYRPILLLPQISKILKKIIYNRLSNLII